MDDLERAFPNQQAGATRLVLTQSTYVLQRWLDTLGARDRIVATAEKAGLEAAAPEAFHRRGPWRGFEFIDVSGTAGALTVEDTDDAEATEHSQDEEAEEPPEYASASPAASVVEIDLLVRAFHSTSAAERLRLCGEAVAAAAESAVAALALSSACREHEDATGARQALDEALRLAPDWEAAHYEDGKFWLAWDDMENARAAFQRACDLMPTFSAAFGNLGATLGELDQPEAALAAFEQALSGDPDSFTILNNIGVVNRELGRLAASEAALRRVAALAPQFVFGHYNLGHTLLLNGRFEAALDAYEEGQRRDPEKNRRQGCRLAVVRFANGDIEGAERDLWHFAGQASPEEREDLLLEAYEVAQAVLQHRPDLSRYRQFVEHIAAEIARSPS